MTVGYDIRPNSIHSKKIILFAVVQTIRTNLFLKIHISDVKLCFQLFYRYIKLCRIPIYVA